MLTYIPIHLSHFSDLIGISIGLCAVCIFVSYSQKVSLRQHSDQVFIKFLLYLVGNALEEMERDKLAEFRKPEVLMGRLQYYVDSGLLKEGTYSAFLKIWLVLDGERNKVLAIGEEYKNKLNQKIESKHLGKISFILSLYGILLLFISGAEEQFEINIVPFIFVSNMLLIVLLLICVISEFYVPILKTDETSRTKKAWCSTCMFFRACLYPTYTSFFVVFFVLLCMFVLSIFVRIPLIPSFMHDVEFSYPSTCYFWTIYISLFILFSGFIAYFFISYIRVRMCVRKSKKSLTKINIDVTIETLNKIEETYKPEIDEMDNKLKNTAFRTDNFSTTNSESQKEPPGKVENESRSSGNTKQQPAKEAKPQK